MSNDLNSSQYSGQAPFDPLDEKRERWRAVLLVLIFLLSLGVVLLWQADLLSMEALADFFNQSDDELWLMLSSAFSGLIGILFIVFIIRRVKKATKTAQQYHQSKQADPLQTDPIKTTVHTVKTLFKGSTNVDLNKKGGRLFWFFLILIFLPSILSYLRYYIARLFY